MTEADPLFCSFCGKSQHEVKTLIAGPKTGASAQPVCICDECACLCVDIIAEEARKGGSDPSALGAVGLRDSFAGQALASGQASNWRDNDYKPVDGLSIIENTARHAYVIADAMMKARAE